MKKDFNEAITPKYIIDTAADVMGGIDFDPCSTSTANQLIQARAFISPYLPPVNACDTKTEWSGNTWLFPPQISRIDTQLWISKAVEEYRLHRVTQLMILLRGKPSDSHIQSISRQQGVSVCFLTSVFGFRDGTTGEVRTDLKSSDFLLFYLGVNKADFRKQFTPKGAVISG